MTAALLIHGGGPTPVLNASLAGVVEETAGSGVRLFGARFGIAGAAADDLVDLSALTGKLEDVARAPGSIIGSSRKGLEPSEYERLFEVCSEHDIGWLFYTGGNGTMWAAQQLASAAPRLQVIGIPKTIDNDIAVTDHTPGYGSAARFAAFFARDAGEDNRSLPSPIMVLEVVGRNVGWVAAATSLAQHRDDDAPHLIYVPERPVSSAKLLADVEQVYRRLGRCVVVVCEGQLDDRGQPFGADFLPSDGTKHQLAANLGHTLATILTRELRVRARAEKPGLLGRSCAALASDVDREEARRCGIAAVRAAAQGATSMMVTLERRAGDSASTTGLVDLAQVAGIERGLPAEWICEGGVSQEFRRWVAPLVGEVPLLPRL